MREYWFRGKRPGNDKWVYGFFWKDSRYCYISGDIASYIVKPETVGQYTCLNSKNGTGIYEGDILHVHDTLIQCCEPYHEFDGYVDFKDGSFRIVSGEMIHYRWIDYEVEIVGNVHDNPELLN